jgi:hypothetical protein
MLNKIITDSCHVGSGIVSNIEGSAALPPPGHRGNELTAAATTTGNQVHVRCRNLRMTALPEHKRQSRNIVRSETIHPTGIRLSCVGIKFTDQ